MYGCCGFANRSCTSAVSTTRPAYMTADPVGEVGDHAEVVGDQQDGRCRARSRSSRSRSRICAWMVTSRAVVGSSAMSSRGLAGERHRDHHPLPHAAGELVRVVVQPPLGGGMPTRSSSSIARWPGGLAGRPRCAGAAPRRSGGRSVKTGLSEVIGSWKIVAISRPRTTAASARRRRAGRAVELDRAVDGRGPGEQAGQAHRGDALAAAGLADHGEHFTVTDLQADPVDGDSRPSSVRKVTDRLLTSRTCPFVDTVIGGSLSGRARHGGCRRRC